MRGTRRPRSGLLGAVLLAVGVAVAGVLVLTVVSALASPGPARASSSVGPVDPVEQGVLVTADQHAYKVLSDNGGQAWGSACVAAGTCTRAELTGTVIVTYPRAKAGASLFIENGGQTAKAAAAGCHLALAGPHGFTYYYLRSGHLLSRTNLQLLCINGVLKIEWR